MKKNKLTLKEKLKVLGKVLLGRRLACKYIDKKHVYTFAHSYWEGTKPYQVKMHSNVCKNCGSVKKIYA